jgi:uncharacterized membrane protein
LNLQIHAQRAWFITMIMYGLLLLGVTADHLLLRNQWFWPVWALQILPLLAIAPGLYARRSRSGIWLCFLLLFYFLVFVEQTTLAFFADMGAVHRIAYPALSTLTVLLFTSGVMYARWQRQVDVAAFNEVDTSDA